MDDVAVATGRIEFLRARLLDDEQVALATLDVRTREETTAGQAVPRWFYLQCQVLAHHRTLHSLVKVRATWDPEGRHIVRHDPARELAGVKAKRRILDDLQKAIDELRQAEVIAQAWRGVTPPQEASLGLLCAQVTFTALHRAVASLVTEWGDEHSPVPASWR